MLRAQRKGGFASPIGCRAQGYAMLSEGDAGAVMEALYSRGPLAVSLDASHDSFRFYASGAPGERPPARAREASGETSLVLAAACQTELCVPSCMHCRTATSFTQLSRPAAGRRWPPVGARPRRGSGIGSPDEQRMPSRRPSPHLPACPRQVKSSSPSA